ncbi:MAG: amidohydrolase [Nitrososphaeraceae archaeon]
MVEAESIFLNGKIHTLDGQNSIAQALATYEGKILGVGSVEKIKTLTGPVTKVVNLNGKAVLPGFSDAHCHVLLFGLGLLQIDLRSATSISEIINAVDQEAKLVQTDKWVRGWGYNDNKLSEKRHPTRYDIDSVSHGHPVYLAHISGHMSTANTKALQLAGIDKDTPDPEGGIVDRDGSGQPTGVFKESAQDLIKRVLPPFTINEVKKALAMANDRLLEEGVTSVQDAWAGWIAPREFMGYQDAIKEELLQVRVILMPDVESLKVKDGHFDFGFGLHSGFGNERLKLGPIKIFIDGSLIGRTAALTQPYTSDPNNKGLLAKSKERILEQFRIAHEDGWQVAMHVIGDQAIEVALETIEKVMGKKAGQYRPRLEHCGVLREDLIQRIKSLGAVVVTQPQFIRELGDGFREALGDERLKLTYPFASLRDLPIIAFSSDRPVVEGAPLLGIQAAVRRQTQSGASLVPEEKITIEEAIRWYTIGAASAAFEEQIRGTLEPGKLADFIVLSENPFELEPERISAIRIDLTVIGGKIVYKSQQSSN